MASFWPHLPPCSSSRRPPPSAPTTRFVGPTFLEQHTAEEVAERFHLRVESIRLVSARASPSTPTSTNFSAEPHPATGRRPNATPSATVPASCAARGRPWKPFAANCGQEGHRVSESYLFRLLHDAGGWPPRGNAAEPNRPTGRARPRWFAEGARRGRRAATGPDPPIWQFTTQVAGLFLFVPQLLALDLPDAVRQAELARFGSHIPPLHAFLACAAAETAGPPPLASVTSAICAPMKGRDSGQGLNVLPKTRPLRHRRYSYRTDRTMHERLIAALIAKTPLGKTPHTFNLDFHGIPFRGHRPDYGNSTGCRRASCSARGDGLRGNPGRRAADHVVPP